MKSVLTLVAFLAFSITGFCADDKPDTPATLTGGTVLTADQAKALIDKKEVQFYDTRKAINFGQGHLAGAVSVSYKEESEFKADFDMSKDSFDLSKIAQDKNAKIGFYSDGPKGWKSYKAAVTAIKAGYKNVFWIRDGFAGWQDKKYPVEQ